MGGVAERQGICKDVIRSMACNSHVCLTLCVIPLIIKAQCVYLFIGTAEVLEQVLESESRCSDDQDDDDDDDDDNDDNVSDDNDDDDDDDVFHPSDVSDLSDGNDGDDDDDEDNDWVVEKIGKTRSKILIS